MRKIKAINFTPKYDEIEDRIRISINYEDLQNRVDLMLTRAFVLKLFPSIDEYMLKYYKVDFSSSTSNTNLREDIQKKVDENTELSDNIALNENKATPKIQEKQLTSKTDSSNLELYKKDDELIREIKLSFNKENRLTTVRFISNNSDVISVLDENMLKQLFTVLKSVIPFFTWGISHHI